MRISDWSSDVCSSDLRARDAEIEYRRGHADDPRDHRQQRQPHDQREADADAAHLAALPFGKLVRQDRDEDEVIDAEHHLHHDQRNQRGPGGGIRSEEHTSALQTLMRISYAVLCLTNKNTRTRIKVT